MELGQLFSYFLVHLAIGILRFDTKTHRYALNTVINPFALNPKHCYVDMSWQRELQPLIDKHTAMGTYLGH